MDSIKRSIIIDTDMGLDDWIALLFLLKQPHIEVSAITIAGTGIAHASKGLANAFELLALAKQTQIPVAAGRETPIAGQHAYVKLLRFLMDNKLWYHYHLILR